MPEGSAQARSSVTLDPTANVAPVPGATWLTLGGVVSCGHVVGSGKLTNVPSFAGPGLWTTASSGAAPPRHVTPPKYGGLSFVDNGTPTIDVTAPVAASISWICRYALMKARSRASVRATGGLAQRTLGAVTALDVRSMV